MLHVPTISNAAFSECGRHRLWLSRQWGEDVTKRVVWVMLNPSTAGATLDDPTIRRCIGFSQAMGYHALTVLNLFTFRATKPSVLLEAIRNGVGFEVNTPNADEQIRWDTRGMPVIAAWGSLGSHALVSGRVARMSGLLAEAGSVVCLGRTRDGQPRHPLMLPTSAASESWTV